MVKAAARGQVRDAEVRTIPWVELPDIGLLRVLQLNCVTEVYAGLWNDQADALKIGLWDSRAPLRDELSRRSALIDLDVIVAQALKLSLDQLIEIYRVFFPVLQEYEAGTWYDRNGRIVWTCSKGLPGVGWLDDRGKSPGRAAWEKVVADNPAELTCIAIDDTMPGGPREVTRHFVGPFTQCDRIEDYRRAWAHFERLKSEEAA
jgi:hypothetical protein